MSSGSERPVVSVVLGAYNRRPFLVQAIESVRQNGATVPYEIVVVDGGSTDGTLGWLVEQKDVVTIVQHNRGEFRGTPIERRSWGYFMNLGFKATQGRYVLMISDDCLLVPGAIDAGVARFQELERADKPVAGVAFYYRNWPLEREYYVQRTFGGKLMVNHGMYRREAMEAVGWADENRYIFYKADGDLCLKMWEAGLEIVDGPGAFVEHYEGANVEVRQTNLDVMTHDREAYHARWSGIFWDPEGPELRGRVTLAYDDPYRTAQRFPLDALVLDEPIAEDAPADAAVRPSVGSLPAEPEAQPAVSDGAGDRPRRRIVWDERRAVIHALETRLALVEAERDSKAADSEERLAVIHGLETRIGEIEAERDRVMADLIADSEQRLALIHSLTARVGDLTATRDSLETLVAEQRVLAERLTAGLAEARAQHNHLEAMCAEQTRKVQQLQEERSALRAEYDTLARHPVVRLFRSKPGRGARGHAGA